MDLQYPHRTLLPAGGRSKAAVDEALDDEFGGVLVSDFCTDDTSAQRVQKLSAGEVMERLYAAILNWSRMAGMSMLPQQARANSIPWSGNVQWMILMFLVSRNSTTGMKSRSDDAKTATS